MADQLATPEDLASLLQQDLDASTANLLLELATAKVQRAAGGQRILELTDTALIDVADECDYYLALPQLPVRAVSLVKLDGVTITDWFLRSQMLWRAVGWMQSWIPPSQVTVTYTHGYPTDSQYIQLARDSTLALAKMGYPNPDGVTSESIDDHKVTYAEADARMQMTEFMRDAIAAQYGSAAVVTQSRRW